LGLTVVEALAGRPIIDGDQTAMMGTTLHERRRPTPRQQGLEVDDEVEAVFERALALDPRDRYPHAGAFWDELMVAVGLEADPAVGSSFPPRDSRSEGGMVPRIERIEAAMPRASQHPPERRSVAPSRSGGSGSAWPTVVLPSTGDDLELDLASMQAPKLPELGLDPRPVASTVERSTHRDEDSAKPLQIALDLGPDERPVARPAHLRTPMPSAPPPAANSNRPSVERSSPRPALASPAPVSRSSVPARADPLPAWRSVTPSMSTRREASLVQRLLPGVALVVLSVVVTLADQVYAARSGELFTLGPLRVVWIAGALMLSGVGLVAYQLLPRDRS
jgi:serine/threonine-protein kinase